MQPPSSRRLTTRRRHQEDGHCLSCRLNPSFRNSNIPTCWVPGEDDATTTTKGKDDIEDLNVSTLRNETMKATQTWQRPSWKPPKNELLQPNVVRIIQSLKPRSTIVLNETNNNEGLEMELCLPTSRSPPCQESYLYSNNDNGQEQEGSSLGRSSCSQPIAILGQDDDVERDSLEEHISYEQAYLQYQERTWRMFDRIQCHREMHPLPQSYHKSTTAAIASLDSSLSSANFRKSLRQMRRMGNDNDHPNEDDIGQQDDEGVFDFEL